jgi:hypothetical protein
MPRWDWWPALVQAHGNAQLYGWCGLFVMGIAYHSLPRMLQSAPPTRRFALATFALVLSGLLIALFAQPLAARPGFGAAWVMGSLLQWAGVCLFAFYAARTIRRPREPYAAFVLAGTAWLWLAAGARVLQSLLAAQSGAGTPPAALNAAYLHAMSWGFLLSFVVGYSLRLLPAFMGAAPPRRAAAWCALAALSAGTLVEVAARLLQAPGLSLPAVALSAVGVVQAVYAVRIWEKSLSSADSETTWLARFARAAYASLAAATVILVVLRVLEAAGPVTPLLQHALGGASRHALTVGFVSLMMVGVAWRILPIFSGAERPHPALIPTVFGLLVAGNAIRVTGQMAAGIWGGPWYAFMGLSGWLETLGVTFFALDVLRLMGPAPALEELPDAGEAVEVSLEAPVGPLVVHRPWLVPVFARHGMGQVSSPIFQRTIGKRVTVMQACARFNVGSELFLRELEAADAEQAGNTSPRQQPTLALRVLN